MIDLLLEQGVVDAEQAQEAKQRPLGITQRGSLANSTYPGFIDLVKRQLREDYRDDRFLLKKAYAFLPVLTRILQRKAEEAQAQTYKQLAGRKDIDKVELAMVVSNPETGEVLALLGSRLPRYDRF